MAVSKGYYGVFSKEGNSILVEFPEHPNINTFGNDWDHAKKMAQEVLSATLEEDFNRDFRLPPSKKHKAKKGQKVIFVPMDLKIWTAYQLRKWREDAGLTQKQISEKLDISYQAYQRMERPGKSNLTVDTLEKIAKALDKELIIDIRSPKAS